jgi:hypothetical protein
MYSVDMLSIEISSRMTYYVSSKMNVSIQSSTSLKLITMKSLSLSEREKERERVNGKIALLSSSRFTYSRRVICNIS